LSNSKNLKLKQVKNLFTNLQQIFFSKIFHFKQQIGYSGWCFQLNYAKFCMFGQRNYMKTVCSVQKMSSKFSEISETLIIHKLKSPLKTSTKPIEIERLYSNLPSKLVSACANMRISRHLNLKITNFSIPQWFRLKKNVQKFENIILIKLYVFDARLMILVLTISCRNISFPIVV
jgi:hypothetical protein